MSRANRPPPPDPLSALLDRVPLRAGVFHVGQICGIHPFARDDRHGHLHLVRRGPVDLVGGRRAPMHIDAPTLLFLPRPQAHRLIADDRVGADVVCAEVRIGGGGANPLNDSLPDVVQIALADMPGTAMVAALMQQEALAARPGRQAVLNRLCELLLVDMLRHCAAAGLVRGGTLAGLADARLGPALAAVHDAPARAWSLAAMAALAGMSRARFALHFRQVVGQPPADYLAAYRVLLAQDLLRAGHPLKRVAPAVGYGSEAALTRAFARRCGQPPARWLAQVQAADAAP